MEDAFSLTPMALTAADSTLPFNFIDELNSVFEPPMSTLFSLDTSSNFHFTCSGNKLDDSPLDIFPYTKEEISYSCTNTNTSTSLSVKKRLKLAFEYFRKMIIDRDVLIQTWMPVKRGVKSVLTTNNQAFFISPNCKSLEYYRNVSKRFQFSAEENDKEEKDFVSRVFLNKLPEWTPDVKFFREDEYLRITYAQQINICGSLVLPVFKQNDTSCVGVIEIVTTTQRVNYHPELESVSKALEAVDLRSFEVLDSPMIKACDDGSYQAALAEIQEILKFVCDQHSLPLAQTWAPCFQQGKPGIRHSHENYTHCVSTVDSACYIPHPHLLGFHEACSEHHLLRGKGLVGEAFVTNQPCFSSDMSAFSKTDDYPLSHHARMFGLRAAIAVRLRSVYTGSGADFVLEFILPFECRDNQQQSLMLDSISCSIQQICRSLRVVTDQEILEEASVERNIFFPSPCGIFGQDEDPQKLAYFEESSWISRTMDAQGEIKPIVIPLVYLPEEPERDFKLTTHWDEDDEMEMRYGAEITKKYLNFHNLVDRTSVEYDRDIFSIDGYLGNELGGRKPIQKRRTKPEKEISLQVIRPYFAGSLKDAAKSIGVCPTTLKRICRQHGIARWPSRKIKKVKHSLRKLQNVINSVQGVDNAFQFGSLYNSISTKAKLNDQLKRQFTPENNLSNDVTCHGRIAQVSKLLKLKVTFGEERIRFRMQQHWQFNDLLNEIAKRLDIKEYCDNNRIEIKYLDDDSEWVLLECDADLDECLEIHSSCGSSMIKLVVNRGLPRCTASA